MKTGKVKRKIIVPIPAPKWPKKKPDEKPIPVPQWPKREEVKIK